MDGAEDPAELLGELARLKEEHRDLDHAIEALESAPFSDRLQLQRSEEAQADAA